MPDKQHRRRGREKIGAATQAPVFFVACMGATRTDAHEMPCAMIGIAAPRAAVPKTDIPRSMREMTMTIPISRDGVGRPAVGGKEERRYDDDGPSLLPVNMQQGRNNMVILLWWKALLNLFFG